MSHARSAALLFVLCCVPSFAAAGWPAGVRQRERLGRGVVAVPLGGGRVFVGWRLLATDPAGVAFHVYRAAGAGAPVKVNSGPIAGCTNLVDEGVDTGAGVAYTVRPVLEGKEQEPSVSYAIPPGAAARPYLSIPLRTLPGHTPNDASVGDLDGDGEYEIVLKQEMRPRDNAQRGATGETKLEAYRLDGTFLWRINLGRNIREGAHYTPFLVYDFDGDGKAEVVCRTADATVDGAGNVIGNAAADHRNGSGYVLEGPEFLTVFEGTTGRALATADYVPDRGRVSDWGDAYGNRVDRFLAAVAYLDGTRPSLVMCRGYYTRTVLAAWNWRGSKLTNVWTFDTDKGSRNYQGQGNHNLAVGDVDGDGRDEIVYGACCIDDDGKGLYSTGLGHGDALHLADIDPDRPGLEVFAIHEKAKHPNGAEFRDARTGAPIWGKPSPDVGRGVAMDVDPRHRGYEMWASGPGFSGLWNVRGETVSEKKPRSCNFGVWWDGDLLREVLDRTTVSKWDWRAGSESVLLAANGYASNNGSKANPSLCADVVGDWREEILWRSADNTELRLYTTTIPTPHRLTTLTHDPQYRLSVAWQNVGYNQPTQTGFYLGDGMSEPPRVGPAAGPEARVRRVFLIGDSTVKNGTKGQQGWGDPLAALVDRSRFRVENRARGGRSSRTDMSEGLWDKVAAELRPGDVVLIQFGHNDGGPISGDRARASLKGNGDETRAATDPRTGKPETVHTYGWYLRKYATDARARGASPVVLSPVPRNIWKDGRSVARASGDYGRWAAEAEKQAGAAFVDLNELVAREYEAVGPEVVAARFFGTDHTHTTEAGAALSAGVVAGAIREVLKAERKDDAPLPGSRP